MSIIPTPGSAARQHRPAGRAVRRPPRRRHDGRHRCARRPEQRGARADRPGQERHQVHRGRRRRGRARRRHPGAARRAGWHAGRSSDSPTTWCTSDCRRATASTRPDGTLLDRLPRLTGSHRSTTDSADRPLTLVMLGDSTSVGYGTRSAGRTARRHPGPRRRRGTEPAGADAVARPDRRPHHRPGPAARALPGRRAGHRGDPDRRATTCGTWCRRGGRRPCSATRCRR